ncbi:MAG: hypothetical protein NZT92_13780 [Abditibacteriales bacterium]|nr:hypothetical protein [Abditibacteriales bacterium]MDW8367024.1 hypothetical protein [Abditibacteriales bacterium]
MKRWRPVFALCGVVGLSLVAWRSRAQDEITDNQPLFEEIHLLNFIRELRLTNEQMESLLKVAKDLKEQQQNLMGKRNSPEVRTLLLQIRQGLIEGKNEEELGPLFEQLEMLISREAQPQEVEEKMRHAAQEKAKEAVALLTPQQIVRLVGREEESDFTARFTEVLHAARRHPQARAELLQAFPRYVARLVARGDAKKEETVAKQVRDLMDEALKLSDTEFHQQLSNLQKRLRATVQSAAGSPFALLQSQVEGRMAETLMHPRFAKVLEEKLNYVKGK